MQALSWIFGSLSLAFLARSYLIGLVLLGGVVWMMSRSEGGIEAHLPAVGLGFVQTLLFPFAKLAWNELRDFLLGNTVFFGNAVLVLLAKVVVNVVLWAFALVIAPLGFGYLWFRTRSREV